MVAALRLQLHTPSPHARGCGAKSLALEARRRMCPRPPLARALAAAACAAAALAAAPAPLPPPAALAAFNASLRGVLVVPGDPRYPAAAAEWNARVAAAPYAVVFVGGDGDVAASLAFASAWALPLAVRSGRHQVEGWSVCTGCLVVDVSAVYADVAVDVGARTVVVGAGATIGALLNATAHLGVLTPVGSCSTVGAAGFVLGGGIGWTSRLHGLAADNLLAARVMLANGSVVVASPRGAHAELAWASAGGGGGNFGVALAFTLALHALPPALLYAEFAYPWAAAGNATAAYLRLRDEPRALFYCLFVRPAAAAAPSVLLQGIWVGDLAAGRAALAPLTALAVAANASGGASASVDVTDYATAHRRFEGRLGARTGNKQKSAFVPPAGSGGGGGPPPIASAAALELVRAALVAAPPDVADHSAVYWNSMGGAVNAVPPNATAFPHRGALLNFVIDAHWADGASAPAGVAWARALFAALAGGGYLGGGGGAAALPTYVNYADADLRDGGWQDAYYGAAGGYARLQRVKAAYDPAGVFAFPQAVRMPAAA